MRWMSPDRKHVRDNDGGYTLEKLVRHDREPGASSDRSSATRPSLHASTATPIRLLLKWKVRGDMRPGARRAVEVD
jgi:hypothetical protein